MKQVFYVNMMNVTRLLGSVPVLLDREIKRFLFGALRNCSVHFLKIVLLIVVWHLKP